mgnify:CR=1 FL=1
MNRLQYKVFVLLSTLAWMLSVGRMSRAQPTLIAAPKCSLDRECARLLEEGRGHDQAGRTSQAQSCYEQAYKSVADPILFWYLAELIYNGDKPADAAAYYQWYLDSGDSSKRQEAISRLEQLNGTRTGLLPGAPETKSEQTPSWPPAEKKAQSDPRLTVTGVVQTGNPLPESKRESPKPVSRRWWPWVVASGATAVIGIGLGIGLGIRLTQSPYVIHLKGD